jgi:hypothetical protein
LSRSFDDIRNSVDDFKGSKPQISTISNENTSSLDKSYPDILPELDCEDPPVVTKTVRERVRELDMALDHAMTIETGAGKKRWIGRWRG